MSVTMLQWNRNLENGRTFFWFDCKVIEKLKKEKSSELITLYFFNTIVLREVHEIDKEKLQLTVLKGMNISK